MSSEALAFNPLLFDNPDVFDIDRRAASRHLSFAQGAHYCIGAGLGRTMCTMAVRTALERMPKLARRACKRSPGCRPSGCVGCSGT